MTALFVAGRLICSRCGLRMRAGEMQTGWKPAGLARFLDKLQFGSRRDMLVVKIGLMIDFTALEIWDEKRQEFRN